MIAQNNVAQQFYGGGSGGGTGINKQLVYVFDESTAIEPFELILDGFLPKGSSVQATLNGIGMTPNTDYTVVVRSGVSIVQVLIDFNQHVSGDTFIVNAQLLG